MAVSNDFLNYVLDQLSTWGDIYVKRMFGGAGLWREGLMFALVANDVVYLKVDETNKVKYIREGSTQLKPFKSQATVLSFYNVPPDIFVKSISTGMPTPLSAK